MNVALIHDWLTGMRGGERVLERVCGMFPEATLHTLIHVRGSVSPAIERHAIRTSFVNRVPGASSHYRAWLPLLALGIERLALEPCDLVISLTHCAAHGVPVPPGVPHLSYVLTPARYAWDLREEYVSRLSAPLRPFARATLAGFRRWDVRAARRPAMLLACSAAVRARIARAWGRDATVLHPPVDVARFSGRREPGDFYLVLGATAPYKRVEDAILAGERLGVRVVVTGDGPFARALARRFAGRAEFRGWVDDREVERLLGAARALIHAGEEDFGLDMAEALAAGCPVVALGRGAALEIVGAGAAPDALESLARGAESAVPGGVLYGTPGADSLAVALRRCDASSFDPEALRARAAAFAPARFDQGLSAAITKLLATPRDETASES